MLTEDDKRRLFEEEEYRLAVRETLPGKTPAPSLRQRLFGFLNTNVGGWFLGTVVVATFGFLWTTYQDRATAEQRRIAETRASTQRDTELVIGLLPHLAQTGSPANSLALGIVRHLHETRTIDPAFASILEAILADIARTNAQQAHAELTNPERRKQYLATAEAAAATIDTQAGPEDAPIWRDLPKRAYIHVPSDDKRAQGEALQSKLREQGLLVPGVQKVDESPDNTEVRYFNRKDKDSAEQIAKQIGGTATQPKIFARQGQIEVWLGKK